MTDEKDKILKTASKIFFSRGFYKIPVDDIASSLRMSKKTIYKHFPTKQDIIKEVAAQFMRTHSEYIARIVNHDYNAVEKLFYIFKYMGTVLISVNEQWFSDIQEQSPEIWAEIEEFRTKIMGLNVSKIIEQGRREGYIVNHPSQIIINIFISSIRGIINPTFILNNKMNAGSALESTINILMNGILSTKGKIVYKKLTMEKN